MTDSELQAADRVITLHIKQALAVIEIRLLVNIVVGADGSDRITAWRMLDGEVAWTSEKLLYRELSAPLLVGRTAIFGDVEGIVHFLAKEDGKALLRLTTDGSPITTAPAFLIDAIASRNPQDSLVHPDVSSFG